MYCNIKKQTNQDFQIKLLPEMICLPTIKNLISERFSKNSYRMYNFYGIEIQDDLDLFIYRDIAEKNKIIFLTGKGEQFSSSFLIKLFKNIKKLGEVSSKYKEL